MVKSTIEQGPLVSVVIPTYNRAHLIKETIQSVFAQTYSHWELIIVDDGSEDDTFSAVKKFNDARVKYLRIEHCGKLGIVRNHGIRLSKGDYIAFLDSDDVWRNDKITFQLGLLEKHQDAAFVFSNGSRFGEGAIQPPEYENLFVGNVFRPTLFEGRFCIYMPSLFFKKSVFDRIELLNEEWHAGCDVDFFYRMSYRFTGIFTNERLVNIRSHAHSTSQKFEERGYIELLKMLNEFKKNNWIALNEFTNLSAKMYYKMALEQYKKGDSKKAVKNFFKHNTLRPFYWKGWLRQLQALASTL